MKEIKYPLAIQMINVDYEKEDPFSQPWVAR